MKVILKDIKEADYASDALILPLCEDDTETGLKHIGPAAGRLIRKIISSGEFQGKHNQITLLHTVEMIRPGRILLAGLGRKKDVSREKIRQAGGKAAFFLAGLGLKDIALSTRYLSSLGHLPSDFVEGSLLAVYKFTRYKSDKEAKGLKSMMVISRPDKHLRESIKWVTALASTVNFARDLVNAPSNDVTPGRLAEVAKSIAKGKVSIRILERRDSEKEGMGAYLSVSKGSAEPPKFIVLKYKGGEGAPVVLIGKSITFDSGGISIKPGEGMEKMKYDMAGGAAVLAVIRLASEYKLPLNLIGILPAAENLPGGSASKPGDIVSTINGKTVEIINTDAEGRLALADAIGYAQKFEPKAIIDIATLTGACSVAFGNEAIAMMGNDEPLISRMKEAGNETYERVWQMPLYEEYGEYIKSDIADVKNTGGKTGSLVTAAYFLKEFAGETPWVHLDIASVAWADKDRPYTPKGATGVGVRLLSALLKEMK